MILLILPSSLKINEWDQGIHRDQKNLYLCSLNNLLHPIHIPHYCFLHYNNRLQYNHTDILLRQYNSSRLCWIQEMQDSHCSRHKLDLLGNHHLYNNLLHYHHMDLPEMITTWRKNFSKKSLNENLSKSPLCKKCSRKILCTKIQ